MIWGFIVVLLIATVITACFGGLFIARKEKDLALFFGFLSFFCLLSGVLIYYAVKTRQIEIRF